MPVSAVGMLDEPFQAEHVLATGQADVVRVGRAFLREPHWGIDASLALRGGGEIIPPQYRRAFRQQLGRG